MVFLSAMKYQSSWNNMEPPKNITMNAIEVAEEIKELNVNSNFAGHYLASNGSQAKAPLIQTLIKKPHIYIQYINIG